MSRTSQAPASSTEPVEAMTVEQIVAQATEAATRAVVATLTGMLDEVAEEYMERYQRGPGGAYRGPTAEEVAQNAAQYEIYDALSSLSHRIAQAFPTAD